MINDTTMRFSTKLLNSYKNITMSCILLGIIRRINESKYTAEVYIPQSNTNLYNVQIGTNILGSEVSIDTLPSVNQKCLVAISAVHYPTIIAIIPNQREETNNLLLSGEAKIGSPEAFMKLSKDKTIGFRTSKSALSIDANATENIAFTHRAISPYMHSESGQGLDNGGYERTVFKEGPAIDAFISKDKLVEDGAVNESLKSDILSKNDQLILGLNGMINEISIFNESKDMFGDTIIQDLEDLRQSLRKRYSVQENLSLVAEYGNSDYNTKNDATLSIRSYNGGETPYSLLFKKDGTIHIDCNDIIINKTGGNKNA